MPLGKARHVDRLRIPKRLRLPGVEEAGVSTFGVRAHDPFVFTAVPFLLFIVASAAVWIPARRASAVDPVVALRMD